MRFSIVLLCIIVHLAFVLPRTLALQPWFNSVEDSICTIPIKSTKTVFVSYLETYIHKVMNLFPQRRTRVNYKVDYHDFYELQETCCKGYKKILDRCSPICFPECLNGICITRDLCECYPGYKQTSMSICTPVCSNGCLNGDCVKPEVCKCFPNYWLDSDGYTCRPACDENCESSHGYCSLPTTCVCQDGYKLSNESNTCKPICQKECVNGKCIEPNVCSCSDGYELDVADSFICKPKCDKACISGTCTAPNVCSCDQGYELSSDWSICKPICNQQCVMGTCIAPEICACFDGYASSKTSMHICEPICEHACVNGTCIAPNTCKCNDGFVVEDGNVTVVSCKPFCTSPCEVNAECTAPERCTCKQGYRVADKTDTTDNVLDSKNTTCIPVCDNDCVNGKCVSPNVCICKDGYSISVASEEHMTNYKHTNSCQAVCNKVCGPNGKCDAPNSCVCDEGYHNMTMGDDVQYVCQPFCESDCKYGKCTNPNVCTCNKGYDRDEKGRCAPVCFPLCINGTCIEPNVCSCKEGFVLRNETICEPICENVCTKGTCVAPNTCQCNENFVEMKSNNASACIPACSRNCSGHGTCLNELNTCLCFFGWTGWDCDETSVCVYKTTLGSPLLSSVTVINETNSTLMESYDNAPLCYQCSDSLNNETLCLAIQSDESLTIPTVGCFLSTGLPCYERPHHNAFKRSTHVTVSLISVTIAIMAIAAIAGYAIIHKRRKQRAASANRQAIQLDEPETEVLIVT